MTEDEKKRNLPQGVDTNALAAAIAARLASRPAVPESVQQQSAPSAQPARNCIRRPLAPYRATGVRTAIVCVESMAGLLDGPNAYAISLLQLLCEWANLTVVTDEVPRPDQAGELERQFAADVSIATGTTVSGFDKEALKGEHTAAFLLGAWKGFEGVIEALRRAYGADYPVVCVISRREEITAIQRHSAFTRHAATVVAPFPNLPVLLPGMPAFCITPGVSASSLLHRRVRQEISEGDKTGLRVGYIHQEGANASIPHFLCRAVGEVSPAAHLVLTSYVPGARELLSRAVTDAGLTDRTRVLPWREGRTAVLCECDAALIPRGEDDGGLFVLRALAEGAVPICPADGSVADSIPADCVVRLTGATVEDIVSSVARAETLISSPSRTACAVHWIRANAHVSRMEEDLAGVVLTCISPPLSKRFARRVCRLPLGISEGPGEAAEFYRRIREYSRYAETQRVEDADIVHSNMSATADHPADAHTYFGICPDGTPAGRKAELALYPLRACRRPLTVSPSCRNMLRDVYGIEADVVRCPADFDDCEQDDCDVVDLLGGAEGARLRSAGYVLSVGPADSPDYCRHILQAAERLSYPIVAAVEQPASNVRHPNVTYIGEPSPAHIRTLLRHCRLLLCPVTPQPLWPVILAACARRKPAVAFDGFDNPRMVRHRESGYLYSNAAEMIEGLEFCWTRAEELGGRAYAVAQGHHPAAVARELDRVYDELMTVPVSVIVVACGNRSTLERAIGSVKDQAEIILVDADGDHEDLAGRFNCLYLRTDDRRLGYNRNAGAELATKPLISFLDGDDYLLPRGLRLRAGLLEKRTDAGVVFGQTIDDRGDVWPPRGSLGLIGEDELPASSLEAGNRLSVHAAMMRKQVFEELNGFDPDFSYMEDYEFWLRAILRFKFVFLEYPCAHRSDNLLGMVHTTPPETKEAFRGLALERYLRGRIVRLP